jgi:transketolase
MALAPVAYTLWQRFLRFDPADPIWPGRDRFVLSAGHASMLLYSLLHLAGVKAVDPDYEIVGDAAVSLEDIESFRQLDSGAPGHPEYRWTSGVETTTGPLGQGVATSVGMAIASKWQGARYGAELFDFDVYAIAGDGCLMEGVSGEAASLAGHLELDNLCWIYDNNQITIDGKTHLAYDDDVAARFMGYGWNVTRVGDANDTDLIATAFEEFKGEQGRPTLIIVDSHIGYGSPHKVDTSAAHGEPLGEEEVRETKRAYGWPEDARFLVPEGVREHFAAGIGKRGRELRAAWEGKLAEYAGANGGLAAEIDAQQRRELPDGWDAAIPSFDPDQKGLATRKASQRVENAIGERLPWLLAGSADLTDSTSVRLEFDGAADFEPGAYDGRQLHFGIREHESAAISNGLSLCKLRPLWSTYLTFSDYARPAIRLSALMELPVIHVFTHDSIGLGEDGPTHQPVEHLAALRAIPGLDIVRPGDANETVACWQTILEHTDRPAGLVLSRQNLPTFPRGSDGYSDTSNVHRGAYVLLDAPSDLGGGLPDVVLIGTGSEVQLAVKARDLLAADGVRARVVSMPCREWFDAQEASYQETVIPPTVRARVSVEAGVAQGWREVVGDRGRSVSLEHYGASADYARIYQEFGITAEAVAAAAQDSIRSATD